ncbi:MAG: anthranilate phosphoribosyltransferase, partial [Candidatus Omnitrophica bacterium]|nr:anthranilate phosphoribosyltransferase [Candidatus Omnitrophota bacterium]
MIREAISILKEKKGLSEIQMQGVLKELFEENASFEEAVELLLLLREKGYDPLELASAVRFMLRYSENISVDKPYIIDVCGTGGDKKSTFNISTAVSFVAVSYTHLRA